MAKDNVSQLDLLRGIRKDVSDLKRDVTDIRVRITANEANYAALATTYAAQGVRLDTLEERFGRIERRLELH